MSHLIALQQQDVSPEREAMQDRSGETDVQGPNDLVSLTTTEVEIASQVELGGAQTDKGKKRMAEPGESPPKRENTMERLDRLRTRGGESEEKTSKSNADDALQNQTIGSTSSRPRTRSQVKGGKNSGNRGLVAASGGSDGGEVEDDETVNAHRGEERGRKRKRATGERAEEHSDEPSESTGLVILYT
ncbi:hypothetical protein FRC08_002965 [Ceratobasidium sp. 394]|nr:hypothetical protein FRC08_002965 [Ceratobasidium sp. 394]